jgi:hypothetical protein
MNTTTFARHAATFLCTVVMSATCLAGAIGPAQPQAGVAAVAAAARLAA